MLIARLLARLRSVGSHHAGSGASHHRFALMFEASPTGMAQPYEVA